MMSIRYLVKVRKLKLSRRLAGLKIRDYELWEFLKRGVEVLLHFEDVKVRLCAVKRVEEELLGVGISHLQPHNRLLISGRLRMQDELDVQLMLIVPLRALNADDHEVLVEDLVELEPVLPLDAATQCLMTDSPNHCLGHRSFMC